MDKKSENEVFQDAIDFFGEVSQKIMAIEEMSELTKELSKDLRDRGNVENIADELADVEITLAQLKMIYNVHDLVEERRDFKLRRLLKSIQDLKAKKEQG